MQNPGDRHPVIPKTLGTDTPRSRQNTGGGQTHVFRKKNFKEKAGLQRYRPSLQRCGAGLQRYRASLQRCRAGLQRYRASLQRRKVGLLRQRADLQAFIRTRQRFSYNCNDSEGKK